MASGKKSYYGPWFWLSAASLVVPVVVVWYLLIAVPGPHTKPEPQPNAAGVDHALWDYLLKTYVEDGLVDYDGLKRDYLFQTYVAELGQAHPEKLATDDERLALLCNAYNALVIAGVINHHIEGSVMDYKNEAGDGFFDAKEHIFAGETLSLNHIEHKLIRPAFQEPRIHMTLVCAARSCPVIRREAYLGAEIERQLEDQATLFTNDPSHAAYDAATKELRLSAILQWYGGDFDAGGGYLPFLAERVTDPATTAGIESAIAGDAKVVFNEYDWALNTQGKRPDAKSSATSEFGSGSIPNE